VPVRLEFLGRELHFGRDTVVRPARLYDRTRARFSDDSVDEKILATGPVESLEGSVRHLPYRDLAHYLEKLDRSTTLAAEAQWAAGKGGGGFLPVRVLWEFFDRAFLRLGLLDGSAGLAFAALSSASTLLEYLKLYELEGWLLCPHASCSEQVPVPVEGFLEDVGGVLPGRGQESPPEVLPERRAKVRVDAVLDDPLGPLLR
jgi:hypothetical protein